VYDSLEVAVRCVQALAEFGEARRRAAPDALADGPRSAVFEKVLTLCREQGRLVVLEHEARRALDDVGVGMARAILAKDAGEAVVAFDRLGRVPVAMKVVSRDIIHKSEAGGVKLSVGDDSAVEHAFGEILESAQRYAAGAEITGILMTPMAPKGGIEVIIGVVHDPTYGPVMMFGLGGILVEVLKDVVFRSLPLSEIDARTMLDEIRAKDILNGVRGAPPTDKAALVRLMMGISAFCTAFPEIAELDLNPVMAYSSGVSILDARILLEADPSTIVD
jgi:acetyltransferase